MWRRPNFPAAQPGQEEIAVDGAARTAVGAAPENVTRPTFHDVFAVREFRALWLAQLLSLAGDQLARLAMTVLVYDRTHSALWTAATYAVTFLPWVVGGLALSGLADRFPRREVMVICDLARLILVCLMALVSLKAPPGPALWVMVVLLFFVTLLDSPFKSARAALIPDILTGERYVLGTAVTQTTIQTAMVAGFALGGLVVAFLGVRPALVIDAATFAASALLTRAYVRARPAAVAAAQTRASFQKNSGGVRLVLGDRRLRTLMMFGWLVPFYLVPMSLAVPYAARFHSPPSPVAVGLVFAAAPFGTAVGVALLGRLAAPQRRQGLMGFLAIAACGLLVLCLARPGLPGSLVIFTISGACAAYQLAANAAFVATVPAERRGQAFGLANGGMQVSQGLWFVAAGAMAVALTPAVVIAVSGGIGALAAVLLAVSWRHQNMP
jgi:MFS family permease